MCAACCLQQPLFPGDSEWQQLLHIFKLLGTPNENVWPGVSRLRDWYVQLHGSDAWSKQHCQWHRALQMLAVLARPLLLCCALTWTDLTARRHEFPQWRPQDLARVFPSLEESGLELLRAMLQYDPARRISVSRLCADCAALLHDRTRRRASSCSS